MNTLSLHRCLLIVALLNACNDERKTTPIGEQAVTPSANTIAPSAGPATAPSAPYVGPHILINTPGKGTSFGWDVGVLSAMIQKFNGQMQPQDLMFSGNSSGSIVAAFLSCYGLTEETLQMGRKRMEVFTDLRLPTTYETANHLVRLNRSEMSNRQLRQKIESFLAGGPGQFCVPQYPLLITAVNGDVVDRRAPAKSLFSSGGGPSFYYSAGDREIVPGTYDIALKAGVHGAEPFYIGKACTYFANPAMIRILQRVPEKERLCEIRPIETPEELVFAVLASASEPVWFHAVHEIDVRKVVAENQWKKELFHSEYSDPYWYSKAKEDPTSPQAQGLATYNQWMSQYANPMLKNRFYIGGYLLASPAQDVRRGAPEVTVISTGRPDLGAVTNNFLKTWYTSDTSTSYAMNRYWYDVDVEIDDATWEVLDPSTDQRAQYEMGKKGFADCMAKNACVPTSTEIVQPKYRGPVGAPANAELPVRRGWPAQL